MDDSALEREQIRQRMLARAPNIEIGDPASPQPLGVQVPQGPPPAMSYQDMLKSLSLAPAGVNVTPTAPLQAPVVPGRVSAPGVSQWKEDGGLGKAVQGMLSGGGGIRDMLARLRAEQAKQAAPAGNVVRAPLAPLPGYEPAPAAPSRAPGPSPQQLIPGLRQPPAAAPAAPPGWRPPTPQPGAPYDIGKPTRGAPPWLAEQSAAEQAMRGPGAAVTGVPAQPPSAAAPGSSSILSGQRADYGKQLDANPAAQEKLMALMIAEEGNDPQARTALAETVFNRGISRNAGSIDAVMDPRYYQPMSDGSGNYEKALQRVRADPALRAQLQSEIQAVRGGSNVSNLATDNASGTVARNSATNQTHAWQAGNGESFFRKDVHPEVHGANAVNSTRDWYNNTIAAQADEKPAAPAAPQAPTGPPGWLADSSNAQRAMSVPPAAANAPAESALTPEALQAAGLKRLAENTPEQTSMVPKGVQPPTPGAPSQQPTSSQLTPNLAKAFIGAVKAEDDTPAPPPPAGAQPVLPSQVAPAAPGAPGGPAAPGGAPGAPTLPAGNAPQMMMQASQGNPIAMAGLAPPPVDVAPTSTPLTAGQVMPNPSALQPPIPWQTMQGWGWSAPDTGGWGGWTGGGFDGGLSGGFGGGE
jgi:hypothetical protein